MCVITRAWNKHRILSQWEWRHIRALLEFYQFKTTSVEVGGRGSGTHCWSSCWALISQKKTKRSSSDLWPSGRSAKTTWQPACASLLWWMSGHHAPSSEIPRACPSTSLTWSWWKVWGLVRVSRAVRVKELCRGLKPAAPARTNGCVSPSTPGENK